MFLRHLFPTSGLIILLIGATLPCSTGRAAETVQPYSVADYLRAAAVARPASQPAKIDSRLSATAKNAPLASREIAGVAFQDQPTIFLNAFERLVGPELRQGAALTQRFPRVADCHDVRCAVRSIFGANAGDRLLYLVVRYNYNASHLAFPDASAWAPADLDAVIQTIEELPPSARPYDREVIRPILVDNSGFGLKRFDRAAGAVSGGAVLLAVSGPDRIGIRLSPAWQIMPQPVRRAVLLHELAHDLERLKLADPMTLAGWNAATERDQSATPSPYVSTYAATSWHEDFAECVVAYRFAPARLKKHAPERYAFLKREIFSGREYGKPAA